MKHSTFKVLRTNEHGIMSVLGVFVGLAGGFGAVGFRYLINFFQSLTYWSYGNLLDLVQPIPWYLRVSVPALGGLVVSPLVYFWARPVNSDYDLYSKGKDGKSQTPFTAKASQDDIVRANDGSFLGLVSDY